jgi:hypothetical protein
MKAYVSKINDRNLQRRRESGITTYALYSVVVIILYQIICLYPKIPFKTNFWDVITVASYSINVFIFLYLSFTVYDGTSGHKSSLRIISQPDKKLLFEQFVFSVSLLLPLVLSGLSLKHRIYSLNDNDWYHISMSILYVLLFISMISLNLKKRNVNHTHKVFDGTGRKNSDWDSGSIIFYFISFVITMSSIIRLFTDPMNGKLNVFIFSILLYSIFFILDKTFILKKNDSFSIALENLEYEINVKNLGDNEIRDRLQNNYMGFLLGDWIIRNLQLIDDFYKSMDNVKYEIEVLNKELQKIDSSKYKIEFEGRLKIINEKERKIVSETDIFLNQKLNEVEGIWKDSNINSEDREELSELYNKLNDLVDKNG